MYRATKFLKNRETAYVQRTIKRNIRFRCTRPWKIVDIRGIRNRKSRIAPSFGRERSRVLWTKSLNSLDRGNGFWRRRSGKNSGKQERPGQPPWYIRFAGDGLPGNPVKSTRFSGINCSVYESNETLFKSRGNTKRGKIDICGISIAKSWCRCK